MRLTLAAVFTPLLSAFSSIGAQTIDGWLLDKQTRTPWRAVGRKVKQLVQMPFVFGLNR